MLGRRVSVRTCLSAVAITGALWAPNATWGKDKLPFPDGVCFPVNGSGFILSKSSNSRTEKVHIGPFSPLVEGDSLVVEKGTITFIDFRNGQSSVFGPGTGHKIPRVIDPAKPTVWEDMKERLGRIFRDTVHQGQEPGATRDTEPELWPDGGVQFAPDVPIVFAWSGVTTRLSAIRIQTPDYETDLPLPSSTATTGELAWVLDKKPYGMVEWSLLDTDGEPLVKGSFSILTPRQADDKRQMYRALAAGDQAAPQELGAVLRALADRAYLW